MNNKTTKPKFLEWVVINNRTGAKQTFRCTYNPEKNQSFLSPYLLKRQHR